MLSVAARGTAIRFRMTILKRIALLSTDGFVGFEISQVPKTGPFDCAQGRLWGTPVIVGTQATRLRKNKSIQERFVVSHPKRKDKDALRMGHPALCRSGEGQEQKQPNIARTSAGHKNNRRSCD